MKDNSNYLKSYEKNKCDPKEHTIIYCEEYNTDKCPKTCYYAQSKAEEKLQQSKLEKKIIK